LRIGTARSRRSCAEAMSGNFNKVFCLGLSRTGTTSLHEAFRVLGLRSVHFPILLFTHSEVLGLPPFRPAVRGGPYAAWRRGKELKALRVNHDARALFTSHDAFCDLPVPLFYKELDRMFPGSKFVLTTRDSDGWLKSMQWLFDDGGVLWKRGFIGDELHHRIYGTTVFDRKKLLAAWERHHLELEDFFRHREGDLLRVRVDRGELRYATLAAFLGLKSQLSGPCPRANEAQGVSRAQKISHRINRFFPWKIFVRRLSGMLPK
jgi:hypothetical protein